MGHNFPIEESLEQEWIAGGAHESFVSWLCAEVVELRRELDETGTEARAAIQRGDTYRARAMALRRQAHAWRTTSEYNKEQADYYSSVSKHLRELLNGEVTP